MGRKYGLKKKKYALTALSLSLGLALALQVLGTTVWAVKFDEKCTFTIKPAANDEYLEDLTGADIVVDVYKVADAAPIPGVDSYTYEMLEPFQDIEITPEIDGDGWREKSQEAAEIVYRSLTDAAYAGATPRLIKGDAAAGEGKQDIEIGYDENPVLECGLYLVVARGKDLGTDYWKEKKDENGAAVLVSCADTREFAYFFAPELVSIPGKEKLEGQDNAMTSNPGDWLYNMGISMKPEREYRFGSLEIIKELESYETMEPATFVFDIEAELDGERVYSNVVSITFTQPGQKSTVLERIPAGATVTVTEVYSGSSYTFTSGDVRNATIVANDQVSVSFTNTYTGRNRTGYGINNHFTFAEGTGEEGDEDHWTWQQWVEEPAGE